MAKDMEGRARLAQLFHNVGNIGMQNKNMIRVFTAYKQSLRLNP